MNPYKNNLTRIIRDILHILDNNITAIGFVSPSHFIPQMTVIIKILHALGRRPVVVYNSNGYDKVEELKKLEGLVDVYLPDFKYMDEALARRYSDGPNYPDIAKNAIREMYRQKGSTLIVNDQGIAESGLIIRHLVLPGHVENSLKVMDAIASELSPSIHISLMSQYHPNFRVYDDPILGRRLNYSEYKMVVDRMESLGLNRGWIQEMDSAGFYRPDFNNERPF
jgi:putative pyruvate formate lyase activating enzyme